MNRTRKRRAIPLALAALAARIGFDHAYAAPAKDEEREERFKRAVVPLKLSAFAGGFRNCSRPTPRSTGYWEVPAADVARIDQALIRHIRTKKLTKRLSFPLSHYARQYLGLERDGRRIVYINARYIRSSWWNAAVASEFLGLCDGGDMAWGIEYDVPRKTFGELELNY